MFQLNHFLNKAIVFFYPEKATYWHTITRNTLSSKPSELGRYYLNFESKLNYPERMDPLGIPLWKTGDEPHFYHPIVICQYALGIFEHLYQSGFRNEKLKTDFFVQADWLVENAVNNGIGKVWYVGYNIPEYGLFKPWYSALSQGEAVSVLTRAYMISKNEIYLRVAEDAIKPFNILVQEGGLLNHFNSLPIYEEYPSPIRPVGALCGFMFVLFGLYDLILANNNKLASELFTRGINSLKELLKFYDLGYWSKYYIFDYPKSYVASFTYHSLQFEQLKTLYILSEEDIFKEYAEKWESYSINSFFKLKALLKKVFYARTLK